jgi:hypothetical protein
MSFIAGTILDAAAELAVPRIKTMLQEKFGTGGKVAGKVIDKVAEKAGVSPEAIPKLGTDKLQQAIIETESDSVELWELYIQSQSLMNDTIALDYKKEQWWAWGWRPAWMWLLGFLWAYQLMLQPIIRASLLPDLEMLDSADLLAVSGIFMALYMGGHTAKKVIPGSKG